MVVPPSECDYNAREKMMRPLCRLCCAVRSAGTVHNALCTHVMTHATRRRDVAGVDRGFKVTATQCRRQDLRSYR